MSTNYYKVLGCRSDASLEEIKRRYHYLVLKCHPDKGDSSDSNGNYSFQEIDEAWKILRDPVSRKAYDEELRLRRLEEPNLIFGTFKLNELDYDSSSDTYSCFCKCGGIYRFTTHGFEQFNSYLITCEQCSLMISVELQ
ncbi:dnaJ homolog subfamily C member 24 [Halyomorpha halys]|uniref:dnaJ homolog subfamily C member 24 n=1 Tax=Halyomorpha halys TaxID=286706 RepID=UPI0006D51106|nr:dnaJ homolog subfamily C member 24 [Halyomorpha halys]